MTRRYHANNVSTSITLSISAAGTSITVTSATGFPAIGSGEVVRATLIQGSKREIIEITDDASTPTFTIARAKEGTTAQAFSAGATIEIRATADSFDRKQDTIATTGDVIDFGSATSLKVPTSAAPALTVNGHLAVDTTVTSFSDGLLEYYNGAVKGVVAMPIAQFTAPTDGYVVKYSSGSTGFILAAQTMTTPGGSTTQVQYNSSSAFAGHSGFTYDGAGAVTANVGFISGGNASTAGYVRLLETTGNGSNYTGFIAPASLAGNVLYTMPTADGTGGYVLSTNGSGTLSWVPGSAGFTPDVGTRNVIIGSGAGAALTTATDNTAMGYHALNAVTASSNFNCAFGAYALATPTTTGSGSNTAVGYQALTASTTASSNTAVGYQSGAAINTGFSNCFIGYSAGAAVTGNNSNTAVGADAMGTGANHSSCVAVGRNALNTTASTVTGTTAVGYSAGSGGTGNVYIGYDSGGAAVTTGRDSNVAVGYESCRWRLANNNTALGYQAGKAGGGAGADNVFIGYTAGGGGSLTGNDNVIIGSTSFGSGTTCATNTAVGKLTGSATATGSTAITTGGGNTLLGYATGVDAADAANALAVGRNAVALKATGATSGTFGPGFALGSAAFPVGFRGDGTIIPSAILGAGFLKAKVNGTQYYIPLYADASASIGFPITEVTGTSQAAAINNGYTANNGSLVTFTLPATAAVGSKVSISGVGAGSWKLTANTGQTIKGLGTTTTSAGNITCANQYDSIEVICVTANTTWVIVNYCSTLLTFA